MHGTPVAVKQLKCKLNDTILQSFNHEVGLMSDIRHPNVLLFLGACTVPNNLCLVTEIMARGNIYDQSDTYIYPTIYSFIIIIYYQQYIYRNKKTYPTQYTYPLQVPSMI